MTTNEILIQTTVNSVELTAPGPQGATGPQGASGSGTTDATTTVKGVLKLAGDLSGTADLPTVPGLASKEASITAGTTSQYWRGDKTFQTLDKTTVGLGNVDNTTDANKPISTATQTALDAKQPLDSDLTAIAGLAPSNDDIVQRKSGAWTNRTPAQLKTDLSLTKSDVGLSNVDNTTDANKPVSTATQTALDAKQPLDSDLTDIAGLAPSNDDIVQRKSGAWTNRTPAQLKTDLGLTKTDVGLSNVDNTSDVNKPIGTATQTALDAKGHTPDVQGFTASGTWTKPSWATSTTMVEVILLGGGGGGGSGRRGAAGTVRCGGGGGGGGGLVRMILPASALGATVAITVGSGGSGGAAVTADDTNGNAGSAGTSTLFGSHLRAWHGTGGGGGTATAGAAGTGNVGTTVGSNGGAASATGGAGAGGAIGGAGQGGTSGGGITSGNTANNGGTSGSSPISQAANGTAGVVDTTTPTAGTAVTAGLPLAGGCGAGGAASITTAAQAGSNAGAYASGGGGGGASLNGNNSGAGGNGAAGIAYIVTFG